jgi:hypothetical protein
VRDNEVVLGINGRLQIVADDARAAARARHGTGVRIGQRYLLIRRIPNFLFARRQVPQLCPQPRDLLRQTLCLRFSNVAFFAVGTIKRVEIPVDIVLHLFHPRGDLRGGVVLVAVVDRLHLAAVYRNDRAREQTQLPTQNDELAAHRSNRSAVCPAEVGDRLEVGRQSPRQPHQLNVPLGFTLEPPARLDPVQIAVEVDLEHRRGMICRATSLSRGHPSELQRLQIERINEGLDCPNRVFFRHVIIERCWQQIVLPTVFPLDETTHSKASRNAREP